MPIINTPQIPELAKGGVLRKGQVGLLEGTGAEAVVPLEKNTEWINKVSDQFKKQDGGASIEKVSAILQNISGSIAQIVAILGKGAEAATSTVGGVDLAGLGAKMGEFLDNANRVMGQMGQATQASYTTSNNNISYDNRSYAYDQKSTFNINDTSGEPRVVADMVDRTQSLRIRNMRGAFS